tara:strand:+ start:458 stop:1141 length:684 start_codon:yes stop_codon:yes gene_type:complete
MPNKKISQLPNSNPLTGEELLAHVQGGVTKKTTLNSLKDYIDTTIIPPVQGYIGLLSAYYFDGAATSSEILIDQVDVWQDVIMEVHALGVSDERIEDMKLAQPTGYAGTGAVGNPIIFLLEGLVESSFATLRTSLGFTPDEDGGRLDARIFFNRHNGAGADFFIDGQALAMESGADEEYPHLVSIEFFVGDTIDTNAPGDAGKVRFQIKSDVTGTVSMREMALFIQK